MTTGLLSLAALIPSGWMASVEYRITYGRARHAAADPKPRPLRMRARAVTA